MLYICNKKTEQRFFLTLNVTLMSQEMEAVKMSKSQSQKFAHAIIDRTLFEDVCRYIKARGAKKHVVFTDLVRLGAKQRRLELTESMGHAAETLRGISDRSRA